MIKGQPKTEDVIPLADADALFSTRKETLSETLVLRRRFALRR